MENQNVSQVQPAPKSKAWIWIVVFIAVVIIGVVVYYVLVNRGATNEQASTSETTVAAQEWVREPAEPIVEGVTSTDTHVISGTNIRTYFMKDREIRFAESTDGGKTFGTTESTGITEESGLFISNPAVLEIADGKWIMVYEQKPEPKAGEVQGNTPPGPDTQRDLYLATSTDGKTFTKSERIVDSSKEDNYFASVPDLVKLSENKVRMYYVSGGESIGSAVSSDEGKTWVRDSGYRLQNSAVDPDVVSSGGKWLMYYSNLDTDKNAIYLSSSTDGLTWKEGVKVIDRTNSSGSIVDPDVFEVGGENIMLFGEFLGGDSTKTQEEPNLYRAVEQS